MPLMKAKPSTWHGYPDSFHIGFFVQDRDEVDRLGARIRSDVHDAGVPKETGHSYGFCVKAPGGVAVEVGA